MKTRQAKLPATRAVVAVFCLGMLSACQQAPEPVAAPPPVVQTLEIGSAEEGGLRQLPGRIEASERAELSFRIAGKLQQLVVAEGDRVEQGQVLAQLAQQDFKTVLADRDAAYKRSVADYQRARQLIGEGYITRRDFDQIEARYKRTKAALGQARADLEYTLLRAPFAGTLAKRHVENHEEIVVGQSIFSLRSSDMVDVKFDVPESIVILIADEANHPPRDEVAVSVSFDAAKGESWPLSFKEMAKKADPKTKTFEVTYLMEAPKGFNVLPGMTASVTINMPALRGDVFRVPVRAVIGDIYMAPRVWLLDSNAMTVKSKAVAVGRLTGDSIEVTSGLETGDVLVTSPSNFLLEGQQVQHAPPAAAESTATDPA